MCITPKEFVQRLGDFGQYCPVSLALKGELVDCSGMISLKYAAEYRGGWSKLSVRFWVAWQWFYENLQLNYFIAKLWPFVLRFYSCLLLNNCYCHSKKIGKTIIMVICSNFLWYIQHIHCCTSFFYSLFLVYKKYYHVMMKYTYAVLITIAWMQM